MFDEKLCLYENPSLFLSCMLTIRARLGSMCYLDIHTHGAARTADSGSMTLLGKAAQSGSCHAQWSAEANALITMFFFAWLVGPLERKPVEVRRGGPDTMRMGTHYPAVSGTCGRAAHHAHGGMLPCSVRGCGAGVRSSVAAAQVTFEGEPATWNSGVQIKKCRYLEASGCVALCVNLCKARHKRARAE